MIPVPWNLEPELPSEDFAKIGQLAIRWSHIDQIIANCLKVVLRLSDDEATIIVFPLNAEGRLNRLCELNEVNPLSDDARRILAELRPIMKGLQLVRNNVIHAFVRDDLKDGFTFHLRSKDRVLSREEVFSSEELTNYAGHLGWLCVSHWDLTGRLAATRCPTGPQYQTFFSQQFSFRRNKWSRVSTTCCPTAASRRPGQSWIRPAENSAAAGGWSPTALLWSHSPAALP